MYRLFVILILFSIGCGKDGAPGPGNLVGIITNQVISSNGRERAYHLYIPTDYINKPVVILFHGNRSSHDDIFGLSIAKSPHSVWLSIAEQNDIILVAPNGTLGSEDKRGWNDCRTDAQGNPEANDVQFIDDLLSSLKSTYDYDEDRVYLAGTSNGGHMAYRLAQELPNRITAFAAIVSSIAANSDCNDSATPISALFMNGTGDPFLPYDGGEMDSNRGLVLSTQQSVDYWIARNATSSDPIIENIPDTDSRDGSTAINYLYQNGNDNTEVAHYEITGGGHTEPSIRERYSNIFLLAVGKQNGDFEMAEEIWDFFKDKSK